MNFNNEYQKALDNYQTKTEKSKAAYENARKYMAGGETRSVSYFNPYPITIANASGSTLYDLDGNKYIDFISNYTSMIHGHAHPEIVKSIEKAAAMGSGCPANFSEQPVLAQILCNRIPGVEQVRFCNSGTEATMFAIRAARAFTNKNGIIKMEGGYHGTTDICEYNVSLPINPNDKRTKIEPTPDSAGISVNTGKDLYIAPFNNLNAIEEILKKSAKDIAGIIVEPVLGASGIIPPKNGYLEGLRSLADQYDVLLIFDEVQTLRLALGGAQEKYNVMPDITAVAKIIGGGLPVGGFGGRADIMSVFDPRKAGSLSQSGTFNGNRVTMAAGIASMRLLDQKAIDKLEKLSARLQEGMKASIKKNGLPFSTTRAGSLLNLHLTPEEPVDYATTYSPYKELLKLYHLEMMLRGIFCANRGTLVVSTVMTEADIDAYLEAFSDIMVKMAKLV